MGARRILRDRDTPHAENGIGETYEVCRSKTDTKFFEVLPVFGDQSNGVLVESPAWIVVVPNYKPLQLLHMLAEHLLPNILDGVQGFGCEGFDL